MTSLFPLCYAFVSLTPHSDAFRLLLSENSRHGNYVTEYESLACTHLLQIIDFRTQIVGVHIIFQISGLECITVAIVAVQSDIFLATLLIGMQDKTSTARTVKWAVCVEACLIARFFRDTFVNILFTMRTRESLWTLTLFWFNAFATVLAHRLTNCWNFMRTWMKVSFGALSFSRHLRLLQPPELWCIFVQPGQHVYTMDAGDCCAIAFVLSKYNLNWWRRLFDGIQNLFIYGQFRSKSCSRTHLEFLQYLSSLQGKVISFRSVCRSVIGIREVLCSTQTWRLWKMSGK